jgi:hypothetical protein
MTGLYEYRVEYDDGRDDEIVESTLPPSAAEGDEDGGLLDEYPDAARIVYVGRVA